MSCSEVPIQIIAGSECIGDSLVKINANFAALGNNACESTSLLRALTANPVYPVQSDTIVLTIQDGTIEANILDYSITTAKLQFDEGSLSFRNKIINGDMSIDQRNCGAAISISTNNQTQYSVDRFFGYKKSLTPDGIFTLQQSTSAIIPFTNSLQIKVTQAAPSPITSAQSFGVGYKIEGVDMKDLGWGTSSAQPAVLGFFIKTTQAGATYGGSIRSGSSNTSYPFSFTCDSTDWEYKAIYISEITSGTWPTDNTTGLIINWSLAEGSLGTGTDFTWSSNSYKGSENQDQPMLTAGTTILITGVVFQVGQQVTPFEIHPYKYELDACRRYYEKSYLPAVAPGAADINNAVIFEPQSVTSGGGTQIYLISPFMVEKRANPGALQIYSTSGASGKYRDVPGNVDKTATASGKTSTRQIVFEPDQPTANLTAGVDYMYHWTADAEL